MIGIISFILALGIIILVHELGHFLVAKHYGILCHEFSIGMGPTVWSKKKGKQLTLFVLFHSVDLLRWQAKKLKKKWLRLIK